jgi:hypothetical protein
MLTLPTSQNDWRLDVVSLLAVIGESSISPHTQAITATRLSLLPRLLPAPQALLKPSRPSTLRSHPAVVVSVESGTRVNSLNYFANLLLPISELPSYHVQEAQIKHKKSSRPQHDVPKARLWGKRDGVIQTRLNAPLPALTIFSFILSVGLLVMAFLRGDGVAVLAISIISFASSIICLASLWQPKLCVRKSNAKVPDKMVVVQTRQGAFQMIECNADVARELYIGAEECEYIIGEQWFKALVGFGTFLLMVAVVLMGNCTWAMQAALGCSYIALNGLYWLAALLPPAWAWNLEAYEVKIKPSETQASFTEALWCAIRATGDTTWVKTNRAAPESEAWNIWLQEAHANVQNKEWDPVGRLQKAMEITDLEGDPRDIAETGKTDSELKDMRRDFEYSSYSAH